MEEFEGTIPEEFYEFEQIINELMNEENLATFLGVMAAVLMLALAVALMFHVFQSVGLYTIAKRRGIQNPWLAWLPVGNYWIAGSIADQYQYVVNGRVTNRRIILLGLNVASFVCSWLSNQIPALFYTGDAGAGFETAGPMLAMLSMATSVLSVVIFVFWQISLYDLYTSCDPKNNVLFLVLGIIFGVTVPFFIFCNRKKELGMPPRKPEPQPEEPQWQPHQPPKEPWDNI